MISRGYSAGFMLAFIVLHLIVTTTGVLFVREVRKGTEKEA